MKKLLSVLALSSALVVPALSNAGPAAPCPACPEMPAPKWGGFKLGLGLGYGHAVQTVDPDGDADDCIFGDAFQNEADQLGRSIRGGARGVLGGFNAGYDFQMGKWTLGAEATFDFVQSSLADYTWSFVPRVGYGTDTAWFTLGVGYVGTDFNEYMSGVRVAASANQKLSGRVILGVEADYDFYSHSARELSAKLKLAFQLS